MSRNFLDRPLQAGGTGNIVNHPFFYEVSLRWMVLLPALLILPGLRAQAPAKSLNELKGFFAANCVKCHGPDGSAHTLEGKNWAASTSRMR